MHGAEHGGSRALVDAGPVDVAAIEGIAELPGLPVWLDGRPPQVFDDAVRADVESGRRSGVGTDLVDETLEGEGAVPGIEPMAEQPEARPEQLLQQLGRAGCQPLECPPDPIEDVSVTALGGEVEGDCGVGVQGIGSLKSSQRCAERIAVDARHVLVVPERWVLSGTDQRVAGGPVDLSMAHRERVEERSRAFGAPVIVAEKKIRSQRCCEAQILGGMLHGRSGRFRRCDERGGERGSEIQVQSLEKRRRQ